MRVTVYSTPNCAQCRTTKTMLDRGGVVYDNIDLTQHPDLADQFKEAGHTQAPIVIAGETTR
jgi:glutaredoxin-like protein NrdH